MFVDFFMILPSLSSLILPICLNSKLSTESFCCIRLTGVLSRRRFIIMPNGTLQQIYILSKFEQHLLAVCRRGVQTDQNIEGVELTKKGRRVTLNIFNDDEYIVGWNAILNGKPTLSMLPFSTPNCPPYPCDAFGPASYCFCLVVLSSLCTSSRSFCKLEF